MKQSLGAAALLYPTPVLLVGTYDGAGKPNIMTAAWGGICCSQPPCVNVSLRKATYTFASIVRAQAFTISIPGETQVKAADFCGLASGSTTDKFARTGLTPVRSALVAAPYVQECPLVLECRVVHAHELGLHTIFVGEVLDVKAEESMLRDGVVDMLKLRPLIYAPGSRDYYGVGQRLGTAFSVGEGI